MEKNKIDLHEWIEATFWTTYWAVITVLSFFTFVKGYSYGLHFWTIGL